MNIKKSILLRVRIAFLVAVLFVLAVVYRMVDIQIIEGDVWIEKAETYSLDYRKIKATRGNIYASGNDLLATSLPFYKLAFDPSLVDDEIFTSKLDSLSHLLSAFFRDHSSDYYQKKISEARQTKRRYLVLNNKLLNYQEKQQLETWPIFNLGQMKGGVIFNKVDKRHNPFRNLAGRTVGYLREGIGVGVERSFNNYLAGQNGEGLFQKVAGNNWMPVNASSDIKPINGYDVHTTIDINLQDVAQNALLKTVSRYNAAYGTVVLMEVKTGEIKAISNLKRTRNGTYAENKNFAVAENNDPGSTFKLASMLALLEAGKVELTDSIDTGEGTFEFSDRVMTDANAHRGGYGMLSVEDVFIKSSNVGTARLVEESFGDNPQEFIDIIKATGFGKPLGFQLMGEGVPYIKDTDDPSWSDVTLPWISVGYETQLTPLQTLTLYNAVANDGKMIQPILVKSINRADQQVEVFESKVLNKRIASKETLAKLRQMLEGVVERGTAKNIRNDIYKIAGKTGTAQKLINGRYTKQKYYASFAGYFPAEDPLYSCIVIIDSPTGWNRFGGDVSAPVFKEIADMIYAQNLEIHDSFETDLLASEGKFPFIRAGRFEELNELCNQLGISNHIGEEVQAEWVRSSVSNNAIIWKENHDGENLVPNVHGMTLRDAVFILENLGLKVSITGTGRVRKQSVTAGRRISQGTSIRLELG